MSAEKVVRIFNNDGSDSEYELLSSRLKKFLKAYPPESFSVVIEHEDYLAARPGMMELYTKAMSSGHKPEDVGLPQISSSAVVFKASLLDANGRVILTASALKPIREYKDWEVGETAARQRLVAAAGFDGASIDVDEGNDMQSQDLHVKPQTVKSNVDDTSKDDGNTKEKSKVEPEPTAQLVPDNAIPAAMLYQIEHLANVAGVDVPEVSNIDEAKKALIELLKK